ncbi:epimerase family protein SDR39U1 [Daphnia magna]|uniref:Epimerase family protein SDR39U1 n=1 Tax=Daphnia magna TaxID=35525 RepID=A0A0P5ZJ71_9CRUS|nr:epimerase family protein SDR39U1 [Daphnia magna]KZS19301.1 Epimerase family protein SDR39U1 [Daphnia magna]CAG4639246.1 EOG090X07KR [Daphnia magna]
MAAKTVVIGGGSGFIGTALSNLLCSCGYDVVIVSRVPGSFRMTWSELEQNGLPKNTAAVVSLAGQNILDMKRRWNSGFEQTVRASRINTTLSLVKAIEKADVKPSVFVSTSGVGYYPPHPSKVYTEHSEGGKGDYFAELCTDWELAAKLPADVGTRQVTIRSGVVLGRRGGMIAQLYLPFFFGMGGPVGSGQQYLPWIHLHDIARLFLYAIEKENVEGVLNGVSPDLITSKEFARAFGGSLWRPALIPLPEFVCNILLGSERARMLTEGQKVIPQRTLELGFEYNYPDIRSACQEFSPLIYTDDLRGDNIER